MDFFSYLLGVRFICVFLTRFDKRYLENRNYHHCQYERHHHVNREGKGEEVYEFSHLAFEDDKQRVKNKADACRRQEHWHKIFMCAFNCSIPWCIPVFNTVNISVDNYYRIVDSHPQNNDKCSQGYSIKRDPEQIHYSYSDKSIHRNHNRSHKR